MFGRQRPWTEEEEQFVVDHLTIWTIGTIARHLGRTRKAIEHWCWRNHQSPTLQHLVTSGPASEITGYTPQQLTALARRRRIKARRKPGGRWWLFDPDTLSSKSLSATKTNRSVDGTGAGRGRNIFRL